MSIALPEAAGQARSTKSEPPLTAANVSLTLESVQTKIKEIEANQRLEEPRKNQLLELYRQAQSHLEAGAGTYGQCPRLQTSRSVCARRDRKAPPNLGAT